jgi:hypothetical protein
VSTLATKCSFVHNNVKTVIFDKVELRSRDERKEELSDLCKLEACFLLRHSLEAMPSREGFKVLNNNWYPYYRWGTTNRYHLW